MHVLQPLPFFPRESRAHTPCIYLRLRQALSTMDGEDDNIQTGEEAEKIQGAHRQEDALKEAQVRYSWRCAIVVTFDPQ